MCCQLSRSQVWVGEPGSREEGLRRLVLLTKERVLAAAKDEIQQGIRVNVGWDLNKLEFACFNRQPCKLEMVPLLDGVAFDDIYTLNPRKLNPRAMRVAGLTGLCRTIFAVCAYSMATSE